MSKIGKVPLHILPGVTVTLKNQDVYVKGTKWELSYTIPQEVTVSQETDAICFAITSDEHRNLWGTAKIMVKNMMFGVSQGYEKKLLVLGVWYAAVLQWTSLLLSLGLSHKVTYTPPVGIKLVVDKDPKGNAVIFIQGIDKQLVWQTAAQIRELKKPEPYKGKGIRYSTEVVKIKEGKTAKK